MNSNEMTKAEIREQIVEGGLKSLVESMGFGCGKSVGILRGRLGDESQLKLDLETFAE